MDCCCSVAKSCLILWPHGLQHTRLPDLSYLSEFAQIHVHSVGEAIQPSCPLLPPSPPALNLSNIRFFSNKLALRVRWLKYWSFSFSNSPPSEYSGLISFGIDWFDLLAVQGTLKKSSPAPQFESINSLALSLLYGPTLTSVHNYWKNHSLDLTPQNLCGEV